MQQHAHLDLSLSAFFSFVPKARAIVGKCHRNMSTRFIPDAAHNCCYPLMSLEHSLHYGPSQEIIPTSFHWVKIKTKKQKQKLIFSPKTQLWGAGQWLRVQTGTEYETWLHPFYVMTSRSPNLAEPLSPHLWNGWFWQFKERLHRKQLAQ